MTGADHGAGADPCRRRGGHHWCACESGRARDRQHHADELGANYNDYAGFNVSAVIRMLTERPAWCDDILTDPVESCAGQLALSFDQTVTALADAHGDTPADWRWGDVHIAPLGHQLLGRLPVVGGLFRQDLPTDGGFYTLKRGSSRFTGDTPFAHVHGAGFRAVYDLSDLDDSPMIIATGQSGNPLSPHFADQAGPWAVGGRVYLRGEPDAVAADGLGRLRLMPE